MRRLLVRALTLSLALVLVAPAVIAEEPIEINAILPLTGQGAFIGKGEQQSLEVFENLVNANGGIRGRSIKFAVADDASKPEVALQLTTQLIARGAAIMIGPGLTATCGAVLPLLTRGPFTYCLAPGIHPPVGSFMFSANAGTADLSQTWVRFARARSWTRIAVISTTDASGQDLAEQIDATLALPENRGIKIVAHQTFSPADLVVSAQVQNIKAAAPQVLIVLCSGTPFGTVLRGVHDAGIDVPIISPSSNMHVEQMAQYASFLPRQLYFGSSRGAVYEPQADPKVKAAQQKFFDAFRRAQITVSNGHSVPWDAMGIILQALRQAGPSASAAQIRDYVAALRNFTGIDGSYDFRAVPQRGIGADGTIVYTWEGSEKKFVIASKPRGE